MAAIIDQSFFCTCVRGEDMDRLWEAGWRHFGEWFFRYNVMDDGGSLKSITPLRIDLERFTPSKSQRRVLRRNAGLRCEFAPARPGQDAREMFQRHKTRFRENIPESLDVFLSATPATVPCTCLECRVHDGDRLVAVSYLDVGARAVSAVYGMFEPSESWRGLGTLTMLLEIEHARALGCRHYYPGYATREPGAYDYKKLFRALEVLDWETGRWDEYRPPGLEDASGGGHS